MNALVSLRGYDVWKCSRSWWLGAGFFDAGYGWTIDKFESLGEERTSRLDFFPKSVHAWLKKGTDGLPGPVR